MHRLFGWERDHPGALDELRGEPSRLQRFVHEALRLHPASPETHRRALDDVELSSGARIPAGRLAIIDMVTANRDRSVFGLEADAFDPDRVVPDDVAPWGLSFGHGFHACLGQELAGGLAPEPEDDGAQPILGAITVMARSLLDHGARPDPDRDPALDPTSTRGNWGAYPVVLGRPT